MKLGLVTAILDQSPYEEMIDTIAAAGLEAAEVACWPAGKATRRYAGVSHIDVERVLTDDAYAHHITSYATEHGVVITNLAFYPNNLDEDREVRAAANIHLMKVIDAAAKLGVNMVGTFIGRMQHANIADNLSEVKCVWPAIIAHAEDMGVRIAIENCPMLFTLDEWPGGQNVMSTPAIWDEVFSTLDSPMLGLNFDPSHFVWQQLDYLAAVREYASKIFHVHFKDIKLYAKRLARVGSTACPLEFMAPKIPGLGDVRWAEFVSALTDIGYAGAACIEVEDRAFEDSYDSVRKSIELSARYLRNFVI